LVEFFALAPSNHFKLAVATSCVDWVEACHTALARTCVRWKGERSGEVDVMD
jgi:hypothetical protein